MKIEIELHEGDFKYKGVEVWAYEESGAYYKINKYDANFVNRSDGIMFIEMTVEVLNA